MDESSEEGVDKDARCLESTGVLGGDVEESGGTSFGDVEGDVDDMKDSDDSKRTKRTEQKYRKTQTVDLNQKTNTMHEYPGLSSSPIGSRALPGGVTRVLQHDAYNAVT